MAKEFLEPASGEVIIKPNVGILDNLRSKWLARTGALVGGLALAAALSETNLAQADRTKIKTVAPLAYYGFDDGRLFTPNLADAQSAALEDRQAGATAVTIYESITEDADEIKHDLPSLCNAAIAARDNGLNLNIDIEGRHKIGGRYKGGELGYVPRTNNQRSAFKSAVVYLMNSLAGDKNPDGSGGCVPEVKDINLILANEWNKELFNDQAPSGEAELLLYLYESLHAEAERPHLNVNLDIMAGSISTTSLNNPVGAVNTLADRLAGVKAFDSIGVNNYKQGYDGTDTSVDTSGDSLFNQTIQTIHQRFGKNVSIVATEVGAINTDTPSNYEKQYDQPVSSSLSPLTSTQQGQFYSNFIESAPCNGINGVMIFSDRDDGTGLRTGISFKNGKHKDSYQMVFNSFQKMASSGYIDCPPRPNI